MKWITMFLVFLLIFPAATFGDGKKLRGNKATVYYAGSKYQGTLLYVNGEFLVLKEKKSEELLGFATQQVEKVYIKKSKAGIGILAGLAVGAGLTGIILTASQKNTGNLANTLLITLLVSCAAIAAGSIIAVFTAVGGGLLGSLLGWKRFKLYKMDATKKEKALQKLKGYALFSEFPDDLRSRLIMVTK